MFAQWISVVRAMQWPDETFLHGTIFKGGTALIIIAIFLLLQRTLDHSCSNNVSSNSVHAILQGAKP